jgi:transposase
VSAESVWVGVDAGKHAHHAVMMDVAGRVLWSGRIANDQAAIEKLIRRARKSSDDVRWAVDLTCASAALLLALLINAAQPVVYVPGRVVNRMSGAFAGEAKTDARDAEVIANTARMRRDLPRLRVPDELVVELSLLTAHRGDLSAEWVRTINRLRALLVRVCPALEKAFDYSTASALILIAGFCTPEAIRRAGPGGLAEYLHSQGARRCTVAGMAAKAVAAAQAQTVSLPGEATAAALVGQLARRLLELRREIKDIDKLIAQRFRTHAQAAIIESLPGMGPILGAEFLVATGGDLAQFGNPGRLAAYAGLAPVPRDSGNRSGNLRRPKRYHRGLRRIFYLAALSGLKANGPSRVFYQRKRGERQRHSQALIALARRLIDVLWALLRDGRTFTAHAPTPA